MTDSFENADALSPSTSTGVVSLEKFSKIETEAKEIETLKNCGLSEEEIKLYHGYQKGMNYLGILHKNMESTALNQAVETILAKIKSVQNIKGPENIVSLDSGSSKIKEKEYSIDPQFQIKNDHVTSRSIHLSHPLNYLNELQDDLFGHMDVDKLPSANKRRKILRRMERKHANAIPIPEPQTDKARNSNHNSNESNHSYNEFVRTNSIELTAFKRNRIDPDPNRNPNSKWDVKDMSKFKMVNEAQISNIEKGYKERRRKIGCCPETLYTIKDNKIVRLEKKSNTNRLDESGKRVDQYETVEIKLPINKAEEELLEGSRLSVEDIKKIPKFENYEPGVCSKTLYIKNVSNSLREEDLNVLFQEYDKESKVTLMVGRMRGQAFVTFTTPELAAKALNERNGTILKGKPIIVQYGKGPKAPNV